MFGLGDSVITTAVLGCIISAAVCVIYGAINWNKSDDQDGEDRK